MSMIYKQGTYGLPQTISYQDEIYVEKKEPIIVTTAINSSANSSVIIIYSFEDFNESYIEQLDRLDSTISYAGVPVFYDWHNNIFYIIEVESSLNNMFVFEGFRLNLLTSPTSNLIWDNVTDEMVKKSSFFRGSFYVYDSGIRQRDFEGNPIGGSGYTADYFDVNDAGCWKISSSTLTLLDKDTLSSIDTFTSTAGTPTNVKAVHNKNRCYVSGNRIEAYYYEEANGILREWISSDNDYIDIAIDKNGDVYGLAIETGGIRTIRKLNYDDGSVIKTYNFSNLNYSLGNYVLFDVIRDGYFIGSADGISIGYIYKDGELFSITLADSNNNNETNLICSKAEHPIIENITDYIFLAAENYIACFKKSDLSLVWEVTETNNDCIDIDINKNLYVGDGTAIKKIDPIDGSLLKTSSAVSSFNITKIICGLDGSSIFWIDSNLGFGLVDPDLNSISLGGGARAFHSGYGPYIFKANSNQFNAIEKGVNASNTVSPSGIGLFDDYIAIATDPRGEYLYLCVAFNEIIKYDISTLSEVNRATIPSINEIVDMVIDLDCNIYLLIEDNPGPTIFLYKLDSNLNVIWSDSQFTGNSNDVYSFYIDRENKVFICISGGSPGRTIIQKKDILEDTNNFTGVAVEDVIAGGTQNITEGDITIYNYLGPNGG